MENENTAKSILNMSKEEILKLLTDRKKLYEKSAQEGTESAGLWVGLNTLYIRLLELTPLKGFENWKERKVYEDGQLTVYQKAVKLDPNVADYWFSLGTYYYPYVCKYLEDDLKEGEAARVEALKFIDTAVDLAPTNLAFIKSRDQVKLDIDAFKNKIPKKTTKLKKVNLPTTLGDCYKISKLCIKDLTKYGEYREAYLDEVEYRKDLTQLIKLLLPEGGLTESHIKTNRALYLVRIFMFIFVIVDENTSYLIKQISIIDALKYGAKMIVNEILEKKEYGKYILTLKGIFGNNFNSEYLYKPKKNKYSLVSEKILTDKLSESLKKDLDIPTFIGNIPDNQTEFGSELDDAVNDLYDFKKLGISIPLDSTISNEIDQHKKNIEKNNSQSNLLMNNVTNYTDKKDVVEADANNIFSVIGENNVFNAVDIALNQDEMNLDFICDLVKTRINEFQIGKMFVCQVPVNLDKIKASTHFVCITKTADDKITIWDPLAIENAQNELYEKVHEIKKMLKSGNFDIEESFGEQDVLDASTCGFKCIEHYQMFKKSSKEQDKNEPLDKDIVEKHIVMQEQSNSINNRKIMEALNKKHNRSLSIDDKSGEESVKEKELVGDNRFYHKSSTIKTGKGIETIETRTGKGRLSEREISAEKEGRSFSQTGKHYDDKKN
jgi:hypothetical protein